MQMRSEFCVAQEPVDDPIAKLTLHPMYIVQDGHFTSLSIEPIPQKLFDDLFEQMSESDIVANQNIFGVESENELDDIYRWWQTGDTIRILWSKSCEENPDREITITTTSIDSPLASGNFYGEVIGDPVIKDDGKTVEIEIKVDKPWHVLIKDGENIDRVSLFYLAALSMKLEETGAFENLLIHAGMRNSVLATSTLAYFYSQTDHNSEAFYWFVKFAIIANQDVVLLVVARILMNTGDGLDAKLAENVLIMLAKQGEKDAFYALGQLHLTKAPGFRDDNKLAVAYLEYGMNNYGDQAAMKALGKLYAIGVGVKQDMSMAMSLFRKSGMTQEELQEIPGLSMMSIDMDEGETEGVDIAVTTALVSLAAVGVYFGWKLWRKIKRGK